MLLTADMYPAEEALSFGLIGRIVPKGAGADGRAANWRRRWRRTGRWRFSRSRKRCSATECLPEQDALALDLQIGMQVTATEDAREGPRAFKEKRTPVFKGRYSW